MGGEGKDGYLSKVNRIRSSDFAGGRLGWLTLFWK